MPDDTRIAHKFGERRLGDEQRLHDCGIVYFTKHPYVLCVMTKGKDPDALARAIALVSSAVYEDVRDAYAAPG